MEDNTLLIVNIFLIGLCLSAIVVIVILIIQNSNMSEEINKEIAGIEKKCPECPNCEIKCPENKECPQCPECPKLPELPQNGECPQCPDCNKTCPKCQDCPTVDDIVTGMFPGRNPKVVSGGKYFEVDAANTYDGLSTSNFYEKNYKFPMDKILKPDSPQMNDYNLGGEEQINNSIENENVNTSKSVSLPMDSSPKVNLNAEMGGPESSSKSSSESSPESSPSAEENNEGPGQSAFDGAYQKILPDNF